ncbi:hypothetical protein HOY82DRAFT_542120 [Tuber indicum]|nr:hypothetical protein HOY82DRAFT_542120 [Tuber indicum]
MREKDPKPEEMLVVQGLQAAEKSLWKKHFYDPIGYTYVNTGGSTTLRSIEALRKETQALRKEGKERVKEVEEKLVAQKEAGEGKEAEELKKKQGMMEDWP